MVLRASALALVRLGLVLLVLGLLSGGWEILAAQAPLSPLHVGVLPGPVEKLRVDTFLMALGVLAGAWLLPAAAPDSEPRRLVVAIHVGVVVTWATLVYGAVTGMAGEQLIDPRWDAQAMVAARLLGYLILLVCLIDFTRRVVLSRRASGAGAS